MKPLFTIILLLATQALFAQKKITNQEVEAGCGMCMYEHKNFNSCAMAVKIDGKIYKVEGINPKEFGPMHTENGYCKTTKKALITGKIKEEKIIATKFTYIPTKK